MRIYIPANRDDLQAEEIAPRLVRLVSQDLLESCNGDAELAELLAHRSASLDSINAPHGLSDTRLVISADVTAAQVRLTEESGRGELVSPVSWKAVACFHIDDPDVHHTRVITAAQAGDDEALGSLWEQDLLWFDASERAELVVILSQ